MRIVLATHNAGKLKEFQAMFAKTTIHIIPQHELGVADAVENGLSFVENAIIKARHAATLTDLPAIADDSGLVVPALEGAPGIYSARYAGKDGKAADNNAKLLKAMQHLNENERGAYFYCVLALFRYATDPTPIICEGQWHGHILLQPKGQDGFGYDPIFAVPDLNLSAAELELSTKNKLSHRAKALAQLQTRIQEVL